MSNIFFCSDHHFGHANILTFFDSSGAKVRNFDSVEEMNEAMVDRHNSVVSTKDKVYFLGDVAMGKNGLNNLFRMKGEKVLIKGNHDKEKISTYLDHFKDVRGSHQFDGMILTHIPIHPASLARWGANVHGHLHTNRVMKVVNNSESIDDRYISVCMEQINYTPISLEDVKKKIQTNNPEPRKRF